MKTPQGQEIVGSCGDRDFTSLGTYESATRALQVLDEIQEHIKSQENEHNYNLSLAKQGTYSTTCPTFELPAE
jgi:vancomycin permeability regulator SanA